jgi:AcrR family transcriptional regulator
MYRNKVRSNRGDDQDNDRGFVLFRTFAAVLFTMLDRRIQRTRGALHEALIALVLEMPYDAITVQQILDRANVGRSTFYTHFQDKDELLMWGTEHLKTTLAAAQRAPAAKPADSVVQFSRAMFEHAYGYRKVYRQLVISPVWPHLRQRIQNILAELIRRDASPELARLKRSKTRLPPELFVHYIASTLMTVLTWWIDHNSPLSPEEVIGFENRKPWM